MPSRNILKIDVPDSYYHLYARGRGRQKVYRDHEDYVAFLSLFHRYLSISAVTDSTGRAYAHMRTQIELLTYCLMPNHFHILVYQRDSGAMTRLMRSVMSSYTRYYNLKYESSGPIFESTYKASRVSDDNYLLHISRYIHLNPADWDMYDYSSYQYYRDDNHPEWLQPERILELFKSRDTYMKFVKDYEENKLLLDSIKHELADY